MPEVPNVITDETIESEWGNAVRDRTVQRYADVSERTAENTSPSPGDLAYIENTGEVDIFHAGLWRHLGVPTGTVQMLAGGAVPIGWLLCNGSLVSRVTYANLYAQIGDTWGAGDGSATFALPDMRGKVPRGVAASGTGATIGGNVGADTHAHAGASHTHAGATHKHTFADVTDNQGAHSHTLESGYAKWGTQTGVTQFYRKSTEDWTLNRNNETHPTYAGGHGNLMPTSVTATTNAGTGLGGDTGINGSHSHTASGTTANPTAANTGAGGTQTGGAASTIQAGAAINFIIKI